jgi:hypothetical protein
MDRRQLLVIGAAAGAAAVVLDPVSFAYADAGGQSRTLTGHIPYGAPDWVYIPVEVPDGINRISVTYDYDRPAPPTGYDGNALDIGVFDENGCQLGNAAGSGTLSPSAPLTPRPVTCPVRSAAVPGMSSSGLTRWSRPGSVGP